jgi:hypothetical protein
MISHFLSALLLYLYRAPIFLPIIFGPLNKCAQAHWNQTVEGLAQRVLKMCVLLYLCLLQSLINRYPLFVGTWIWILIYTISAQEKTVKN